MKALKLVLEKVLPEHKAVIRDTIAPEYMEAVGAAYWSKLQIDQSETFHLSYDLRHAYDEL